MLAAFFHNAARTPAFLNQLIYGVGPSSTDTERRYPTIRYDTIDDLHWETDRQAASFI